MTGEKVTVQNFFDKNFGNIPYEGGFGQEGPPLTMFGNWAHQVPSRPALVPPPYGLAYSQKFFENILLSVIFPVIFVF